MKKTGVQEWAAESRNIQIGCENGCRYCYAQHRAVNRFKYCTAKEWKNPAINQKKVKMGYGKKVDGGIMFPSTHDITPRNLAECLIVLEKMLCAGNEVLIVSKPHLSCIQAICDGLAKYEEQIKFRFTIGSISDQVLKFWEPEAPGVAERVQCLQYAFEAGYKTSVSCEPYLDRHPELIYDDIAAYVTDSIWFGLMRNIKSRVDMSQIARNDIVNFVRPLDETYSDRRVLAIVELMKDWEYTKWKDSIQEVIARNC